MAYVRITDEMRKRVGETVERMKQNEIRHLQIDELSVGTPEYESIVAIIEDDAWGKFLPLKAQMPSEWFSTIDSVEARFMDTNGLTVHRPRVVLSDPHDKFPPNVSRWGLSVNIRIEKCNDVVVTWLANIAVAKEKKKECEAKFSTIRAQLLNFLTQHASLNTALKELPELEMYVPSDYMDRVREKVVRNKPEPRTAAEDEPPLVDKDLLTSTAVAARIQGVKG
jgi:hypothetical protein